MCELAVADLFEVDHDVVDLLGPHAVRLLQLLEGLGAAAVRVQHLQTRRTMPFMGTNVVYEDAYCGNTVDGRHSVELREICMFNALNFELRFVDRKF